MKFSCKHLVLLGLTVSMSVLSAATSAQQTPGSPSPVRGITELSVEHPYGIHNPYRLHNKRHKHRFYHGSAARQGP